MRAEPEPSALEATATGAESGSAVAFGRSTRGTADGSPGSPTESSAAGPGATSPDPRPLPLTPATSGSTADESKLGRSISGNRNSSGWNSARNVLTVVKTTNKFTTLRDLIGTDAYIEPARLRVGKALGEGAFAKVARAELWPEGETPRTSTGGAAGGGNGGSTAGRGPQVVAVKTLRQELLTDPAQVELFVKEVSLMRKLKHRHIVKFVGCSWTQKRVQDDSARSGATPGEGMFFLQEFCAGGSLGDLLRKQMIQPFKQLYTDADALRWCLHIAQALQYLHESRPVVIHRDLKLENVMLSGTDLAHADAKLGDFGLARLTLPEEKQKMERLTKLLSQPRKQWDPATRNSSKSLDAFLDRMLTGTTVRSVSPEGDVSMPSSMVASNMSFAVASSRQLTGKTGSFGYMAPEVSRSQQYNGQADIFSLGMCMYCLFCRSIPTLQIWLNGDASHLELYAAKVADGYRPPLLPGLPDSVVRAIEVLWKGDPELRPNARGAVEMLQRIRDSGDVGVSGADSHIPENGCCCAVM